MGLPEPAREFAFTEQDFRFLKEQAYAYAGIALSDHKKAMIYSRLARRIRQLGMKSVGEYCELLSGDGAAEESTHFINAITTNLTKFFRESHHYEHLGEYLKTFAKKQPGQEFRLWSAGCSRGMEVYSAAITLFDIWPQRPPEKTIFLATDIDTRILQEAEQGIYSEEEVESLSAEQKRKYCMPVGGQSDKIQMIPRLREIVRFRHLNFMKEWPIRRRFNIIFCRNVLIYFDRETQQRIISGLAHKLLPGGVLYIGHSESIGEAGRYFEYVGKTTYIRNEAV